MGFIPGEGLPYGIHSGGSLLYGIISGGGGGARGNNSHVTPVTGFALFCQHDVYPTQYPFHTMGATIITNHIYIELCLLPINLHIASACK